jgi:N-alpha-acetyltransferase 35, NatC auxiliary subunit
MDSGLILDEEARRPQFNPLAPLLPEEVCYILDRVIACEVRSSTSGCSVMHSFDDGKMEWHAGYTLPQTIFSCLYVHYLADIDPEVFRFQEPPHQESARPLALVTVVLRAAITALLKCCDLSWRELNRGRLHDVCTTLACVHPFIVDIRQTEDWHSEKFGVSLLESLPVASALSRLDDAKNCIRAILPGAQGSVLIVETSYCF